MHQPTDAPVIKFYKLKTLEDIVAYEVDDNDGFYRIRRPLAFSVENEMGTGRQLLNVREWIPPIVSAVEEVCLPKEFVIFSTEIRESFREEFHDAVEYLYGVTPKKRFKSNTGKVVPISAMMKDTSSKPH